MCVGGTRHEVLDVFAMAARIHYCTVAGSAPRYEYQITLDARGRVRLNQGLHICGTFADSPEARRQVRQSRESATASQELACAGVPVTIHPLYSHGCGEHEVRDALFWCSALAGPRTCRICTCMCSTGLVPGLKAAPMPHDMGLARGAAGKGADTLHRGERGRDHDRGGERESKRSRR